MKKLSIAIPKIRRRATKMPAPGAMPGTLQVSAGLPPPVVAVVEYGEDEIESTDVPLDELEDHLEPKKGLVVWVDVHGVGDADVLRRVGAKLGLHPLTLEDIAHPHQRPKIEEFENYLFATVRAVRLHNGSQIDNEQISFVLRDGLLITFQERSGDGFDPVRKRIRDGKGVIRRKGADYLLYALLDAIVDNYFPVIEAYSESMEQLDEQIRENPAPGLSRVVHTMRRELRQLRRAVWPLREMTGVLGRNEIDSIDDSLRASFRDCHDHVVQVADFIEGSRERASDLGDLYQTMVSEKTNQVMKTLTIVATIFIPLTFLCGLYGMNFDPEVSPFNMPELKWRYGYLAFWGVMIVTFLGMIVFFRRRGWIGSSKKIEPSQ
jgi:magnesium transporter